MIKNKILKKPFSKPPSEREQTAFEKQIAHLCAPLLGFCDYAVKNRKNNNFPCRDFLKKLNTEATSIEELIDDCGAQKNEKWFTFREAVAAEKLFTAVYSNMLHIKLSTSRYRLLDIEEDFNRDTEETLKLLKKALVSISNTMLEQSKRCGVYNLSVVPFFEPCEGEKQLEKLPANRSVRHVYKIGETVVYLATKFLNFSEDRDIETVLKSREQCDFENCVPETVNEEKIRLAEVRFHNLQSMYDTYIFESDIESQNRNLPFLRGHISIIFHLLQTATDLSHYYIRHMSMLRRNALEDIEFPLTTDEVLEIIFNYLLHYARVYRDSATHLCRAMIKSYSKEKEIEVPIPNYRGFHVRPSTLIAKIVAHYGSTVRMYLNGNEYNAGAPLELFRANEEINAMKRRYIAEVLSKKPELQKPAPKDPQQRMQELQILFLDLMNEDIIMLYESNLSFEDLELYEGETMADLASRYIKHFMSIAKIDVRSNLTVTFHGDNRALNDLKLLAENGYGEDKFGNNIVLPKELSYLKR
jgi:hypothetical protein